MSLRRVVVTGLGALTPIGNDVSSYWDGLISGKSGADLITYFDTSKFKTQFACELKGFDPLNYLDRKEARKLDKFAQYAIVCSDEAIKDSGLDFDKVERLLSYKIRGFTSIYMPSYTFDKLPNEAKNFRNINNNYFIRKIENFGPDISKTIVTKIFGTQKRDVVDPRKL